MRPLAQTHSKDGSRCIDGFALVILECRLAFQTSNRLAITRFFLPNHIGGIALEQEALYRYLSDGIIHPFPPSRGQIEEIARDGKERSQRRKLADIVRKARIPVHQKGSGEGGQFLQHVVNPLNASNAVNNKRNRVL